MPSGVTADALTDIEQTRARMLKTQRDLVDCVSATREIIDESRAILAEADRLLDLRDGM